MWTIDRAIGGSPVAPLGCRPDRAQARYFDVSTRFGRMPYCSYGAMRGSDLPAGVRADVSVAGRRHSKRPAAPARGPDPLCAGNGAAALPASIDGACR